MLTFLKRSRSLTKLVCRNPIVQVMIMSNHWNGILYSHTVTLNTKWYIFQKNWGIGKMVNIDSLFLPTSKYKGMYGYYHHVIMNITYDGIYGIWDWSITFLSTQYIHISKHSFNQVIMFVHSKKYSQTSFVQ